MPKFSSFNAFGSEAIEIGQSHTPVWLGVVTPVPVGGTLKKDYAVKGLLLNAGFPVNLNGKIITPFIGYEVVSYSAAGASDTYDTIVVKPVKLGGVEIAPAAEDVVMKVGATFATAGAARAIYSSTLITEGTNAGCYTILIAKSANLGSLEAGDVLTPSATAGASGKLPSVQPNGYLYNDIYFGELGGSANDFTLAATGAVVVNHHEGLLVELTPAAAVKAQMAAAVPGVYQVLV
jgi:hypothetical protein